MTFEEAQRRAEELVRIEPMPTVPGYRIYLGDECLVSVALSEDKAQRIAEPYRKTIAAAIFKAAVDAQAELMERK